MMSLVKLLIRKAVCLILIFTTTSRAIESTAIWGKMATSSIYDNTKLVLHNVYAIQTLDIRKGTSIFVTRSVCMQACNANPRCRSINFYSTDTQYRCELMPTNFCSQSTRMALQVLPGGTVLDKLLPGMNRSCIDQRVRKSPGTNICDIGRPGCRSTSNANNELSSCTTCVRTCADCAKVNNVTTNDFHVCTLWPRGSYSYNIFGYCKGNATYLFQQSVDTKNGNILVNNLVPRSGMSRLSELGVYNTISFMFKSQLMDYTANYEGFTFNSEGSLSKMTYRSGNGDGFNLDTKALLSSQWTTGNTTCGSFWYVKSNQSSASCPGGDISIFGAVNVSVSPVVTGIRWPIASINETLYYAECKLDF